MDEILPQFKKEAARISSKNSIIPFISSLLAQEVPGERLDGEDWGRHLRESVNFYGAFCRSEERIRPTAYLEIGPKPLLSKILQSNI
jgi:acyl transferase domain-containing protein